jgi:hypothetical protein
MKARNVAGYIQERIMEGDAPLGYLTDNHLKWIRGYVYYRFGFKNVLFGIDFTSKPRRVFITPVMADGKIINRLQWMKMMFSLWRSKDSNKPLLHPCFWSGALNLHEWKFVFSRKEKRSKHT